MSILVEAILKFFRRHQLRYQQAHLVNEEENIKVYGSSGWKALVGLVLGGGLILFALFALIGSLISVFKSPIQLEPIYSFIGATVFAAIMLSQPYFFIFKNLPQLELSPEGIKFKHPRRSTFYAWKDVGVFAICDHRMRFGTIRFLCAYNDISHDTLVKEGEGTTVSMADADIAINLSMLTVGQSNAASQALADEVNEWRGKYGAPENNALNLSPSKVRAINAKQETRISAHKHMMFTILAVLIILFVAEKMSK